jgi:hypothetical protein
MAGIEVLLERVCFPFQSAIAEVPTYDELYSGDWDHPVATGPWELTG